MEGKAKPVIGDRLPTAQRALGLLSICCFTHLLGVWQPAPACTRWTGIARKASSPGRGTAEEAAPPCLPSPQVHRGKVGLGAGPGHLTESLLKLLQCRLG